MTPTLAAGRLGLLLLAAAGLPVRGAAAAEDAAADPAALVQSFHHVFGEHHARAVHAKGIVLRGEFTPAPEARTLSRAGLFAAPVPAVFRFSDFTGLPDIPDASPDASPRGLAIKFQMPNGEESDIVAHSFNGFPVATAADFGHLLEAIAASGPGAAKPTALETFFTTHPAAKTFLTTQKPAPVSFATVAYYGVNAFTFTNAGGERHVVRYRFVPAAGEHALAADAARTADGSYLQQEIVARLRKEPVRFDWYAQLAGAGDRTDDPSTAWPDDRRLVRLGTFTIRQVDPDQQASTKALLFLPARVPDGIAPADPMLDARNASYPISYGERQ